MQRADKIQLIVATVLVVLLAAGTGVLLYKRSVTLSNDKGGTPTDVAVKLTPLEDTSTAGVKPSATATTTPLKPSVPKQPKGSIFGYVTKVGKNGRSLRWDLAELVTGSQADLYAKRKGMVVADQTYYLANDTHKIVVYDVSQNATIEIVKDDGTREVITPGAFKKMFDAKAASVTKPAWYIWQKNGEISRMTQAVLPPIVKTQ